MERIESLPPEIELAQLLQRVGAHDAAAFRLFYEKTAPLVFARLLRLLRQRRAAEEALHETYVRAWERAAQYQAGRGRPLAWLVHLARYCAFDLLQRMGDGRIEDHDVDELPSNNLDAAISHLSDEARRCLQLAYVEGRTPAEIAVLLSRPPTLVRRCIRAALLGLRHPPRAEKAA